MSKAGKSSGAWYSTQAGEWINRLVLAARMDGVHLSESQCQELVDILTFLLFRGDGRK